MRHPSFLILFDMPESDFIPYADVKIIYSFISFSATLSHVKHSLSLA